MSKKRAPEIVLAEFGRMLRSGRVETLIKPGKTHGTPWRMRLIGSSGADYAVTEAHPLDYHLKVAEARFNAELSKLRRVAELPGRRAKALSARLEVAASRSEMIRLLAKDPLHMRNGKPIRKKIAATMTERGEKISYSQVCRILSGAKKKSHD